MKVAVILYLLAVALLAACEFEESPAASPVQPITITLPESAQLISVNSSGYGQATLTDLDKEDVFLVKVNMGGGTVSGNVISTGIGSAAESERAPAGTITTSDGQTLTRYELRWPLVLPDDTAPAFMRSATGSSFSYANASLGGTHDFYVEAKTTTKTAILKKIGKHCRIWVPADNFDGGSGSSANNDNKVTQTQIDALANKFDAIYPIETALLGYEYGGGGNGGADSDPKIQILVYDIDGDFGKPRKGITLGYFYAGDEFSRKMIAHSNEAEIVYLDSEFLDSKPATMHSTLIHEFNHMINYNVKVLQTGRNWDTWYTEMLSMLAEDVIGPLAGIPSDGTGHVISERIPQWLADGYAPARPMWWDDNNPLPTMRPTMPSAHTSRGTLAARRCSPISQSRPNPGRRRSGKAFRP